MPKVLSPSAIAQSSPTRPTPKIADYGVIGNLHTTALVSRHGSVDFLSYPRFDSSTAFARLLDTHQGGSWSVQLTGGDADNSNTSQHYLPDTAILVTRLMHEGGIVEITDFMPPVDDVVHCQLIRMVRSVAGASNIHMRFEPRFPYGAEAVRLAYSADTHASGNASADGRRLTKEDGHPKRATTTIDVPFGPHPSKLYLDTASDLTEAGVVKADFALSAGEVRYFVLQSEACKDASDDLASFSESLLEYSLCYWQKWVDNITYSSEHRDLVIRSAITLKLCTSAQFGSSVAAATFGLPEVLGGGRNYDYRYTWIRDSAFTMYAMLRLGLSTEATQFIQWIEKRCAELDSAAELNLMYRVDGSSDLKETELDYLSGYEDSTPVRIGNGASGQRQLDIYGELIDTVYLYDRYGHEITYEFWRHLIEIIDYVADTWSEPDHGMWEVRGETQQFTMSKVMAWVAIDRGLRIAEHRGFPAPRQRWEKVRDEIYTALYEDYYNKEVGSWTQVKGKAALDGGLLMLPLVRFVMTEEPNWQRTLAQIEEELVDGALVRRYAAEGAAADGFEGTEGYFTMCSFWYIECLAKADRLEEARRHMTTMASYSNHLGLYSEEIAMNGEPLGNFPQAFTHLGFISAALQVAEHRDRS